MPRCLLALGANLGQPAATMHAAACACAELQRTRLLARSQFHRTQPVGGAPGQPSYLNGTLLLDTELAPHELLNQTQAIEQVSFRTRSTRWGARTLDIDLLLYDDLECDSPDLVLPHPRMSFRRFVLEPAVEVAHYMVHPECGWTLAALLAHWQKAPPYVAVTAPCLEWAAWLTDWLSDQWKIAPRGSFSPAKSPVDDFLQLSAVECQQHEAFSKAALVIVIDPPDPVVLEQNLKQAWANAGSHPRRSGRRIVPAQGTAASDRPRWGPVARLRSCDPSTICHEAQAAIQAAWPELVVSRE